MVRLNVVARGRDLLGFVLWFYFCEPPRVTMSELGGHLGFLNKERKKQEEHVF